MDTTEQQNFYRNLAQTPLKKLLVNKNKNDAAKIREWYKNQPVNSINKIPTKGAFYHIRLPSVGFIYVDLMDFSKYAHSNGGNNYILTAIDGYSRFAWAFPIKHKKPEEILPNLKIIRDDLINHKYNFLAMTSDAGGEFKGSVQKWLDNYGIKHYLAYDVQDPSVKNRNALVESFNGVLSSKLTKATFVQDNTKWIDALPTVMLNYNKEPSEIFLKHKKVEQPPPPKADKVKIGDFVRTRNIRATVGPKLGLRGTSSYSDQVYRIIAKDGYRYVLTDAEMRKIIKSALARNLQVVGKPVKLCSLSLVAEKKEATKSKKFIKLQRDSQLDVAPTGDIIKPIAPKSVKREKKAPSYLKDYVVK